MGLSLETDDKISDGFDISSLYLRLSRRKASTIDGEAQLTRLLGTLDQHLSSTRPVCQSTRASGAASEQK